MPTLDPERFPLVAYAFYRPAGGIIITIVNHADGIDDAGRRELLLVLDRYGWHHATLHATLNGEAQPFVGDQMRAHLTTYNYRGHPDADGFVGNHAGWIPVDTVPQVGRPVIPTGGPMWALPVVSMAVDGVQRCLCNRDLQPPRSYCLKCKPGRQEAAYLYAVQPPRPPAGISALRGRP